MNTLMFVLCKFICLIKASLDTDKQHFFNSLLSKKPRNNSRLVNIYCRFTAIGKHSEISLKKTLG